MADIIAKLRRQNDPGRKVTRQPPLCTLRQIHLPAGAWAEQPNTHSISIRWQIYLGLNNYAYHFEPLKGTERNRYMPIIEEVRARETERNASVLTTFRALRALKPKMDDIYETHDWTKKKGRGRPRRGQIPSLQVFQKDKMTLSRGLEQLDTYFSHLRRKSRHGKTQQTQHHEGYFKTRFGIIKACTALPLDPWYMAHRPGDPIVHIKRAASPTLFHVPALAGKEDDEEEMHQVGFEGVVPFDYNELYQRFTKHAYSAFMQMVIVALSFDPRDPRYRPLATMKYFQPAYASEFDEVTEKEKACQLAYLRSIWRIKYGKHSSKYPRFLQDQIATSISRFREIGWLMSKLEQIQPQLTLKLYWRYCKDLLKDITGRDAVWLAQDYFDITLAAEAEEMLEDGDTEDIFFYHQTKAARARTRLQDFYVEDFEPLFGISDEQLQELDALVTKYEAIQLPTQETRPPFNPSSTVFVPVPTSSIVAVSEPNDRSTNAYTDEPLEGNEQLRTASEPPKSNISKKRARPWDVEEEYQPYEPSSKKQRLSIQAY